MTDSSDDRATERRNPYASPADLGVDPTFGGAVDDSWEDVYVRAARRRKAVVLLYLVSAALIVVYGVLSQLFYDTLLTMEADVGSAESGFGEILSAPGAAVLVGMGFVSWLVDLAAMIMLAVWTYSAYRNLVVFENEPQRYTPGWAVAYWFIPVISLIRPVQVMNDVWRLSLPPEKRDQVIGWKTPAFLVAWWVIWILFSLLSITVNWAIDSSASLDLVVVLLGVVPAIMTALLVRFLGALQDARAKQLGLDEVS